MNPKGSKGRVKERKEATNQPTKKTSSILKEVKCELEKAEVDWVRLRPFNRKKGENIIE